MKIIINKKLPNALAIATFPSTAMMGTKTMEEPRPVTMSTKSTVWFPKLVEKGGSWTDGIPDLTAPKN